MPLQILRAEQSHTNHREFSGVCFSWSLGRPASPGAQRSSAPATPTRLRLSPTQPELPLRHSNKVNNQPYSYFNTTTCHKEALQKPSDVGGKKKPSRNKKVSKVSQAYCILKSLFHINELRTSAADHDRKQGFYIFQAGDKIISKTNVSGTNGDRASRQQLIQESSKHLHD